MTVSLSKILFYCVQTVLSIGDIGLVINISSLWSCGCGCGVDWLCFTQTFTSSRWFFLSCPPLLSSECFWVEDYLTNLNIFLDGAQVCLLVFSGQLQHSCPDCREIQQGLSGCWWSTPTLGSHVAVQDMTVHCTVVQDTLIIPNIKIQLSPDNRTVRNVSVQQTKPWLTRIHK